MFKIAYYEFKKLLRNKRWFFLILIQPILMIVLLGSATMHYPKNIPIIATNVNKNVYSDQIIDDIIKEKDLNITQVDSAALLKEKVGKNKYRAGVIVDVGNKSNQITGNIEFIQNSTVPEISSRANFLVSNATKHTLQGFTQSNIQTLINNQTDSQAQKTQNELSSQVRSLEQAIGKLPLDPSQLAKLNQPLSNLKNITFTTNNTALVSNTEIKNKESRNTTRDIKYFDFYGSAIVILLILIMCLNMSSTSITQERIDGTFERFFVTPFTKAQMVMGKMLTFSVISLIVALVAIGSLTLIYQVNLGPIWLVLLITYLTCLAAVALGLLVSTFTYSVAESIQVSIIIFFISIVLTRFIFQPETMHPIMSKMTNLLPFTYSIQAMREVNILNIGFIDVWSDIVILAGSVIVFIVLAILLLHRKAN